MDAIKELLDRRAAAAWAKDIDELMAVYSADVVYFDIVPPLRYTGADALRGRFTDWFSRWQGPIRQELAELEVLVSGDVAAAHMLVRAGGTTTAGLELDYWVRLSDFFRRGDDGWRITHEHVSLPIDMAAGGTVVMDLKP
jgi:ketosteroid isomerase-like protein